MMQLYHYTLSTGHARMSDRSEIHDDVVAAMTHWIVPGSHDLPIPGDYKLVVPVLDRGFWGTVQQGERTLATIVVARNAFEHEYLWPFVEKQYHSLTDLPGLRSADYVVSREPTHFPYCVAYPIMASPDEAMWLGDFERCLAWTWLET